MNQSKRGPHHISHEENNTLQQAIASFGPGDVFVREGAPHMYIDVKGAGTRTWIVNLLTGNAWEVDGIETVYPATEVYLSFRTSRR